LIAAIRQLPESGRPTDLVLCEGFATFKPEATEHVSDAQLLLNFFSGSQLRSVIEVKTANGQVLITRRLDPDCAHHSTRRFPAWKMPEHQTPPFLLILFAGSLSFSNLEVGVSGPRPVC
jgi:hypothetical protein